MGLRAEAKDWTSTLPDNTLPWARPEGDVLLLRRLPLLTSLKRLVGLHARPASGSEDELFGGPAPRLFTNVPWTVVQHSDLGYEIGYRGSGPHDLALNILNMFVAPGEDGREPKRCRDGLASRTAWELHTEFLLEFVEPLPREPGAILDGRVVRSWIEERRGTSDASGR